MPPQRKGGITNHDVPKEWNVANDTGQTGSNAAQSEGHPAGDPQTNGAGPDAGGAAANGQAHYGKRTGGAGGTFVDGDGPDALAEWGSGVQWADELNVDPETPIADVCGAETWNAVRKFCRKYEVSMYLPDGANSMVFSDFNALPRAIWHTASPKASLTRGQVAEFAADTMTDDPHRIGEELKRKRSQRFRDQQKTTEALAAHEINPGTAYTIETLETLPGIGGELARQARRWVSTLNRWAWSATPPHNHTEHTDLITARELCETFKVDPTVLAAANLAAATLEERLDAQERLTRARKHYAKFGAAEELNFAAGMVTPSQMMTKSSPRPMLGHFLYYGQQSELIGPASSGKTFVGLDMGLTLASRTQDRVKVLYVAAEAAESVYLRVLGWCVKDAKNKIEPKSLDGWFTVYPQPVQLGVPEHMRQVRAYAARHDIGLIVFDTRAMVTLGLNENDSEEQGAAIIELNTLNRAGVATLVVHHTPKDGTVGAGGRGSGAWFAASYTSMHLAVIEKRNHLVCDKLKDDKNGCHHEITYADVHVPEVMMPQARKLDTRAVTHLDPFDTSTEPAGSSGLNETQLTTLFVIATLAEDLGISNAKLESLTKTDKNPGGYEIGSRGTIYKSLRTLRGATPDNLSAYITNVSSEKAAARYRATKAGWDLLVSQGRVNSDYADTRRHSTEDLGRNPTSPPSRTSRPR